jgi:hypothetical protein
LTDRVLLYSLQVDGRVLAMNLSLRAGVGLFGLQGVYDESYAKFAPGIQLWRDVVDRFQDEDDALWLDSCTYAGNETLLRSLPDRRPVSTFLVGLGGPVDRVLLFTAATGQRLLGDESTLRHRHPVIWSVIYRIIARISHTHREVPKPVNVEH